MMAEVQKYMDSLPKTVGDVKALLCSECQATVPWYEGLIEFEAIGALVVETAARGHQACLEAVLSWKGTTIKDMMNHGSKPRFHPGDRPLIKRDRFGDLKGPGAAMVATVNGHLKCLEILRKEGFGIYYPDSLENPIALAARFDHRDCFRFLLDVYKEYDDFSYLRAFHHAIEAHSIKCLKWLVAEGANVNKTDDKGISPLMFHGTESVDSHMLKALIDVGADVNQKDEQGRTALMFRAMDPDARCMETLIEAGADVNATCKKRQTAMMYLMQMPFSLQFILFHTADCVVVLLRAGYKVNVVNKDRLRLNALTMLLCRPDVKNQSVELLLFAAGERVKLRAVRAKGREIPEYLEPQFSLKDICRRKIREHLLRLDPHTHLFGRVPMLEIPTSLHRYLLYDQTLDKTMDDIVGAAAATAAAAADDDDDDDDWTDNSSDSDSNDSSKDGSDNDEL